MLSPRGLPCSHKAHSSDNALEAAYCRRKRNTQPSSHTHILLGSLPSMYILDAARGSRTTLSALRISGVRFLNTLERRQPSCVFGSSGLGNREISVNCPHMCALGLRPLLSNSHDCEFQLHSFFMSESIFPTCKTLISLLYTNIIQF